MLLLRKQRIYKSESYTINLCGIQSKIKMQHQQLKWIVVGCISLFGLGFYFNSLTKQQKIYRKKLQQFEDIYKQSKLYNKRSLKEIMQEVDKNSSKIVCLDNLKPEYKPDTFNLYQREISVFAPYPQYKPQAILQHQMGNEFYAFRQDKEKILCKLNDFHLSAKLLQEKRQDINLFKQINQLEAIVQTATSTLYPLFNVAIYGKLCYDSNRVSWAIEPFFLAHAFELSKVVDQFYKQKIQSNNLTKFAISLGGIILGYFSIVSPLKSWFRRMKSRHRQNQEGPLDDTEYFKKKSHITVKEQSLLNCEKCRRKNVEMVYECGHLAICVQCHDKNISKECPLCETVSTKFMKIFMA